MDIDTQGILSDARQRLAWGFEMRYILCLFGLFSLAVAYYLNGHHYKPFLPLLGFLLVYNVAAHLFYVLAYKKLKVRSLAVLQGITQLLDLVVITALIYYTGLLDSPYWFLYLVMIILSGFGSFSAYSYSVFFIAFFSVLFYTGLLILAYLGILPAYGLSFIITPQQLLLIIFNRALYTAVSFSLFAVTLFYFSKNLNRQKEALSEQNQQLLLLNEELKILNQMKDDLIANLSHELRTPLSIVKDGIGLILDGIPGSINDKQREYLLDSKESIDRLTRIVGNLLNIAKIENKSFEINAQPMDIVQLARKVMDSFAGKADKAGLTMEFKSKEASLQVLADEDKICEVFFNLIDDAIKFTPQGGRITIGIKDAGRMAECFIQDTGVGIPKEDQKKIFQRFFRANHEPGKKGVGLGLAICKGIVELHQGKIWVESEVGWGTRFIFTLPKFVASPT